MCLAAAVASLLTLLLDICRCQLHDHPIFFFFCSPSWCRDGGGD